MTEVSLRGNAGHHAVPDAPQKSIDRTVHVVAFATLALLLYAALPWRSKQYFSDQLDAVVLAKTALMLLALAGAVWLRTYLSRHGREPNRVPAFAFIVVFVYFCSSTLGAFVFGSFSASVKLSMRATVFALVVLLLLEVVRPIALIELFARLLSAATILAAATGRFGQTGRLTGAIPPLHPNEIAFLAAIPLVYYAWRTANHDFNALRGAGLAVLAAIVVLTDSRTISVAVLVTVALVMLRGRRRPVAGLALLGALLVPVLFLLIFTDVAKSFSDRGGTSPVDTLGSRKIAWDAVLNSAPDMGQMLVGRGLAMKKVAVEGQWWTSQILDSSWISAYVQAGLIGVSLGAVLVIYTITRATRAGRPNTDLWIGLLVLVAIRSIFESGLLDTSTCFIVMMLLALGAASEAKTATTAVGP